MPGQTAQRNTRPPVIVIMGHIDHGKSTLLDYIRKTNVTEREAGGITQHVSAYEVDHEAADGGTRRITFLDTPGHAAFSSIRERGVRIADIAILMVSAEDGVKPQTLEALNAIKEAKLPYIVAINKIDKPSANIERTKMNLAENGIYIEGYGGDVPAVPVSAKSGQGVPELLDMMLLVAEMQEFTTDPASPGDGFVLESNLDPKKGLTATLIVKDGRLERGQYVAAGPATAPVRIMENFLGKPVTDAEASSPVRIIGWDRLPSVGSPFKTFGTKKDALDYAAKHAEQKAAHEIAPARAEDGSEEGRATIPVILKTDTFGSLEAVMNELRKVSTDKVDVRIIHGGIGTVSENDLRLSEGGQGSVVVSFNTKPDATAKSYAQRNGIEIREFSIIYKLTEWFEELVKQRTPKVLSEEVTGEAKILKVFSVNKDKQVVGGRVESGTLKQGADVKLMRREAEIGRGKVKEIQHNKHKVASVEEGAEFGTLIESPIEIAPGDRVAAVEMIEK